jgi:hypothetical protein
MKRSLVVLLALVGGSWSCNAPTCGTGTKQVQDANGNLVCQPADGLPSQIDCDVDGGAIIVAGHCVSREMCGPNTTPKMQPNGTISCEGSGVVMMPHVPPACSSPPPGSICVNGTIRNLIDHSYLSGTQKVQVTAHDPNAFLGGDMSALKGSTNQPAQADNVTDTFILPDILPPTSGLFTITVGGEPGDNSLQLTGCGAKVAPNGSFTVDCYVTTAAMIAAWKTQAGVDYDTNGAYVACFFGDPLPDPMKLTADETSPLSGVKLIDVGAGAPAASVHYFGGTTPLNLMTIDPALTSTGTSGCAVAPNNGNITPYTGMGGMYMGQPVQFWETEPGGSAQHVVVVQRLHRCMNATCM